MNGYFQYFFYSVRVCKRDETETSAPLSYGILHDENIGDGAEHAEILPEFVRGREPAESADEELSGGGVVAVGGGPAGRGASTVDGNEPLIAAGHLTLRRAGAVELDLEPLRGSYLRRGLLLCLGRGLGLGLRLHRVSMRADPVHFDDLRGLSRGDGADGVVQVEDPRVHPDAQREAVHLHHPVHCRGHVVVF